MSLGAAEQLVGLTLLEKWKVIERIRRDAGISGASRSACYRAISLDGVSAFVKAFDFRREELIGDTDKLERMVREFNHERNVHFFCRDQHMSRITRIHDAGKVVVDGEAVHFLVCEWGDKCLRESQPPGDIGVPIATRFTAMRNVAAALAQLHGGGVAHQDVKPSNAVCFGDRILKLTDLGSSSCESMPAPPHDLQSLVGQPNYAPYELLYDYVPATWRRRRFGCDLFLLGNLCFTVFVGGSLTVLALHAIPARLRHTDYSGDYAEVVPHLIDAHHMLLPEILIGAVPSALVPEVSDLIFCLCHPDPSRRGHSRNLMMNAYQFGLERFITKFEVLAKKSEILAREAH